MYDCDLLNMLLSKHGDVCELITLSGLHNTTVSYVDKFRKLWNFVAMDDNLTNSVKYDISNVYVKHWPENMKCHIRNLCKRDMEGIVCGCNGMCETRVETHIAISIIVNTMLNSNLREFDINILHTTWKQLVFDSNGCYRDISAIILSSSSALWSI